MVRGCGISGYGMLGGGVWVYGVWGSGEWPCGVWCPMVWPPLHLLHEKTTQNREFNFRSPSINFVKINVMGSNID